jgi:hypothetical protein
MKHLFCTIGLANKIELFWKTERWGTGMFAAKE